MSFEGIQYLVLIAVIVFGTVLGELYRTTTTNITLTGRQFIANFLISIFSTFLIMLYTKDYFNSRTRLYIVAGLLGLQDYTILKKITEKITKLKLIFEEKEGED